MTGTCELNCGKENVRLYKLHYSCSTWRGVVRACKECRHEYKLAKAQKKATK